MSEEAVLLVEKKDGVATLTLNRPKALNALSFDLRAAFVAALGEIASDGQTRVAIPTGNGRAFCAGLDLKELGGETGASGNPFGRDRHFGVVDALDACPIPVIGAINGFAITGGFELALACDFLVASTDARFADTHARVGIVPGWGLSQRLSRLIGIGRAKEVSLTGNFVSAEKALEWGLVNRVVAPDKLLPTCLGLAADIQSCVPEVVALYKKLIDDGFSKTLEEGRAIEVRAAASWKATPEQIAERRQLVQERGRKQSETD